MLCDHHPLGAPLGVDHVFVRRHTASRGSPAPAPCPRKSGRPAARRPARPAAAGELLVGVARDRPAVDAIGDLHQARTVNALRRHAAPQIGRAQEAARRGQHAPPRRRGKSGSPGRRAAAVGDRLAAVGHVTTDNARPCSRRRVRRPAAGRCPRRRSAVFAGRCAVGPRIRRWRAARRCAPARRAPARWPRDRSRRASSPW